MLDGGGGVRVLPGKKKDRYTPTRYLSLSLSLSVQFITLVNRSGLVMQRGRSATP